MTSTDEKFNAVKNAYDVDKTSKTSQQTVADITSMVNNINSFSLQDSRMKRLADRIKTILNS